MACHEVKDHVRPERSGVRVTYYSDWHRACCRTLDYITDVDWLEYRHNRECVALIEVKQYPGVMRWPQEQALNDLATRAGVPFFLVTYGFLEGKEESYKAYWFHVEPKNEKAKEWLTTDFTMSSNEYAEFLRVL